MSKVIFVWVSLSVVVFGLIDEAEPKRIIKREKTEAAVDAGVAADVGGSDEDLSPIADLTASGPAQIKAQPPPDERALPKAAGAKVVKAESIKTRPRPIRFWGFSFSPTEAVTWLVFVNLVLILFFIWLGVIVLVLARRTREEVKPVAEQEKKLRHYYRLLGEYKKRTEEAVNSLGGHLFRAMEDTERILVKFPDIYHRLTALEGLSDGPEWVEHIHDDLQQLKWLIGNPLGDLRTLEDGFVQMKGELRQSTELNQMLARRNTEAIEEAGTKALADLQDTAGSLELDLADFERRAEEIFGRVTEAERVAGRMEDEVGTISRLKGLLARLEGATGSGLSRPSGGARESSPGRPSEIPGGKIPDPTEE